MPESALIRARSWESKKPNREKLSLKGSLFSRAIWYRYVWCGPKQANRRRVSYLAVYNKQNGMGIKTYTLIDTGANGFIFIDTGLASLAIRHLDVDFKELKKPYTVKGFDGKRGKTITYYLELNLYIDRIKQQKLPMLVVKLRGHDMILGRAWAEKYNTLVDCCNRQLIWPDEATDTPSWNKVIAMHKKNLFPKAKAEH